MFWASRQDWITRCRESPPSCQLYTQSDRPPIWWLRSTSNQICPLQTLFCVSTSAYKLTNDNTIGEKGSKYLTVLSSSISNCTSLLLLVMLFQITFLSQWLLSTVNIWNISSLYNHSQSIQQSATRLVSVTEEIQLAVRAGLCSVYILLHSV